MQTSLRLPTQPVDVRITLVGGREDEATVFLPTLSPTHDGPETLDEFLNRPRRFLPVRLRASERSALVSRDAIVTVSVAGDAPVRARQESPSLPSIDMVQVQLEGGGELDGMLLQEGGLESGRLSDFFNGADDFFCVATRDRFVFVHKQRALSVTF